MIRKISLTACLLGAVAGYAHDNPHRWLDFPMAMLRLQRGKNGSRLKSWH